MCIGIWLVGLVVNVARSNPPLFLPSIVGGVFWCTGRILITNKSVVLVPRAADVSIFNHVNNGQYNFLDSDTTI